MFSFLRAPPWIGSRKLAPLETIEAMRDKVLDIDLKSIFFGMREVLPHMIKRKYGCVSSEGWHVQQEKGLPGQESEAP